MVPAVQKVAKCLVCKVQYMISMWKGSILFISLCTQYFVPLKECHEFVPYVNSMVCKMSKRICMDKSIKNIMLYVKFNLILELIFKLGKKMLIFVVSLFVYDKCIIWWTVQCAFTMAPFHVEWHVVCWILVRGCYSPVLYLLPLYSAGTSCHSISREFV